MKGKAAIVDYDMGNLYSILKACRKIDMPAVVTSDKNEIINAAALILPGVGAFSNAVSHLNENGLHEVIIDFIATGKPVLGICLGMQLLMTESEEFGLHKGFNLIPGKVVRFPNASRNSKIRVPQMNWNRIFPPSGKESFQKRTILETSSNGEYFYFVHSYYARPVHNSHIMCETAYGGIKYASGINKDNIFAVQFHPEKSGSNGLNVLLAFKNLIE